MARRALRRVETTLGPVAFGGRTLTLVARTTAVHLGDGERGALHLRSRPLHVEVLDEHGGRDVVRIRDTERLVVLAVAGAGAAGAWLAAAARRRGRRRAPTGRSTA